MITTTTPHVVPEDKEPKYMNIDSLLDYCRRVYDLPISRATIYRERNAGKLRSRLVGGRLLFPIVDVRKWIEGDKEEASI